MSDLCLFLEILFLHATMPNGLKSSLVIWRNCPLLTTSVMAIQVFNTLCWNSYFIITSLVTVSSLKLYFGHFFPLYLAKHLCLLHMDFKCHKLMWFNITVSLQNKYSFLVAELSWKRLHKYKGRHTVSLSQKTMSISKNENIQSEVGNHIWKFIIILMKKQWKEQ